MPRNWGRSICSLEATINISLRVTFNRRVGDRSCSHSLTERTKPSTNAVLYVAASRGSCTPRRAGFSRYTGVRWCMFRELRLQSRWCVEDQRSMRWKSLPIRLHVTLLIMSKPGIARPGCKTAKATAWKPKNIAVFGNLSAVAVSFIRPDKCQTNAELQMPTTTSAARSAECRALWLCKAYYVC